MLELKGLTRRYGDVVALDDLSFTVAEGQMLGFVGPTGAVPAQRVSAGAILHTGPTLRLRDAWRGPAAPRSSAPEVG